VRGAQTVSASLRAGLARLLLVLCLLGVQWAAAVHAASHLAAASQHSGDSGEGGAHAVCMECLAFHPLDGGLLPSAVPSGAPAKPLPALPGPACSPPLFPVGCANSRAPPLVL
jgi:hypothetical protein